MVVDQARDQVQAPAPVAQVLAQAPAVRVRRAGVRVLAVRGRARVLVLVLVRAQAVRVRVDQALAVLQVLAALVRLPVHRQADQVRRPVPAAHRLVRVRLQVLAARQVVARRRHRVPEAHFRISARAVSTSVLVTATRFNAL